MNRWARALVVTGLVVIGMGGGGAVAYWQGGGRGTGQTWVGTPAADVGLTTVLLVVTSDDLYPGGTADVMLQLKNPNPFPIVVTGIRQDGAVTVSGDAKCTADNAAITVPTATALSVVVAASTTADVHVPRGAAMGVDSANACQSRTFRIPVVVTVRS